MLKLLEKTRAETYWGLSETCLKILYMGSISSKKHAMEMVEHRAYGIKTFLKACSGNEVTCLYFQLKELKQLETVFIFNERKPPDPFTNGSTNSGPQSVQSSLPKVCK